MNITINTDYVSVTMAQNKLSPRKKQAIFRYSQYALLAVIAVLIIALADWTTLSSQVFNLEVAQK